MMEQDDARPRRRRRGGGGKHVLRGKAEAPICASCDRAARLTAGEEIYPHRRDLWALPIWKCDGCGGTVGCHPNTTRALGIPANARIRALRHQVHKIIDPIWQAAPEYYPGSREGDFDRLRSMARSRVYAFMAAKIGIEKAACHTGMFGESECLRAVEAMQNITYREIRDHAHERIRAGIG